MPTKIKFDADEHKYFVHGREIPSVTTVLKEITILDDRWFKPGSDELGTRVHEYLDLIDKGFKVAHPPSIAGYIKAYLEFRKNNPHLDLLEVERTLYDRRLHVCGKVDRIFKDTRTDIDYVIDIKSGSSLRYHTLQCTAYACAYGKKDAKIGALYLSGDGKYKFKELERRDRTWRACVLAYNFKVRR